MSIIRIGAVAKDKKKLRTPDLFHRIHILIHNYGMDHDVNEKVKDLAEYIGVLHNKLVLVQQIEDADNKGKDKLTGKKND